MIINRTCPTCGGDGFIVERITVYERGYGRPHDGTYERPCPDCDGCRCAVPDPDYEYDLIREGERRRRWSVGDYRYWSQPMDERQ